MFKRRDVLKFAMAGLSAPAIASTSFRPGARPADAGRERRRNAPRRRSRRDSTPPRSPTWRATSPGSHGASPSVDLPEPFNALNHEQYVGDPAQARDVVWRDQATGFVLEPTQRGFIFNNNLQINVVEDGVVRRLVYDPADYTFGKLDPPADRKDIGFSGFKLWQRAQDGDAARISASSRARAISRPSARGQAFGASARALAVRPVDQGKGEEFPHFAAVWIERPVLAANTVVIHALLDSESVTGAFRYTMRPGDATIVDTECTLFTRAAIDNVGIAAMQGTFLFGPIDRRRGDDVRPGVYDVAGCRCIRARTNGSGGPSPTARRIQLSAFVDDNPKGFGFLQRDRDFALFADDDKHWEARPSLWIEPLGDWGPGHVTLIEIPAESEVNQNIIVYWRPRATLAANSETTFAYRQFWCWTPPDRPPLATVMRSRSGRVTGSPPNARRRRFLVDFRGDVLADAARFPE